MTNLIERLRRQEVSNDLPDDELCSDAADALEESDRQNKLLLDRVNALQAKLDKKKGA